MIIMADRVNPSYKTEADSFLTASAISENTYGPYIFDDTPSDYAKDESGIDESKMNEFEIVRLEKV